MRWDAATILVVLVLLVTSACASAVELNAPTWHGTWRGNGEGASEGALTIWFGGRDDFGEMATFDVDMIFHGPACATSEGVPGRGTQTAAELPPAVHFAVQVGDSVYRFDGTRSGYVMDGTYTRVSGSCTPCDCGLGESGTWEASS